MTKKLLTLILSAAFVVSLTACKKLPYDQGSSTISSTVSFVAPVPSEETYNSESTSQQKSDLSSSELTTSVESTVSSVIPSGTTPSSSFIDTSSNQTSSSSGQEQAPESQQPEQSPTDEPTGVNVYRPDYNIGTCKKLSGEIAVAVFYMDDFESSWTAEAMQSFTDNEIKPGLEFIKNQAAVYGVDISFKITDIFESVWYYEEVVTDIKGVGLCTIDVPYSAANELGFASDFKLRDTICTREKVDEVIFLTVFNKNGTAYGINPKRGYELYTTEHCVLFSRDLNSDKDSYYPAGLQRSVVAHEILHLYGAEDLYTPSNRKTLAQKHYPDDIMLSAKYFLEFNDLGDATAFYVGWHNNPPEIIKTSDWGEPQ